MTTRSGRLGIRAAIWDSWGLGLATDRYRSLMTLISHIEEAFSGDNLFDPIKTGIVSVLGNSRIPAAYEMLLRLLEHESAHIVNWAGDALGKFNNINALPAMVAANERIGGEKLIDTAIQKLKDLQNPA